eukprot:1449507-Rhodomonas_salina.3
MPAGRRPVPGAEDQVEGQLYGLLCRQYDLHRLSTAGQYCRTVATSHHVTTYTLRRHTWAQGMKDTHA